MFRSNMRPHRVCMRVLHVRGPQSSYLLGKNKSAQALKHKSIMPITFEFYHGASQWHEHMRSTTSNERTMLNAMMLSLNAQEPQWPTPPRS